MKSHILSEKNMNELYKEDGEKDERKVKLFPSIK